MAVTVPNAEPSNQFEAGIQWLSENPWWALFLAGAFVMIFLPPKSASLQARNPFPWRRKKPKRYRSKWGRGYA